MISKYIRNKIAETIVVSLFFSIGIIGWRLSYVDNIMCYAAEKSPDISENFEGNSNISIPRGDVSISLVNDCNEGSWAISVSNRIKNWNGVQFSAEEFRGNTIKASAYVKSSSTSTRLSIQYDIYGSTNYSTINSINSNADQYLKAEGTFKIPENADNIFVYIEADGVDDIFVDDVSIQCVGEYIKPGEITMPEYQDTSKYPSLKDMYNSQFKIGSAISKEEIKVPEKANLISEQFNSITMGNEFKPDSILDYNKSISDLNKYNENPAVNFENVVDIMEFAKSNNMEVRGHTLIWHSQTPTWLFYENYDLNGELASRELMLKRMENYIKSVMDWTNNNYPGIIYAWDVVNEAIDDNTNELRDSYWYKTIGADYVERAFEFSRKYAPKGTELFYNDYNEYNPQKREGIIKLLKPIAEAGNLDGMGMQSHISTSVYIPLYIESLEKYYTDLNVKIHITELDIEMPKCDFKEYEQAVYYNKLFKALINEVKLGIPLESVTIWGVTDDLSWKASNEPLLFNSNLSYKEAFTGVVDAINGDELEKPEGMTENLSSINENFEQSLLYPRGNASLTIVNDEKYSGENSLKVSNRSESWNGAMFDISRFRGKNIKYSAYVKSNSESVKLSANIGGIWPTLQEVSTKGGEWTRIEGIYNVPDDLGAVELYFETDDIEDFYIDDLEVSVI